MSSARAAKVMRMSDGDPASMLRLTQVDATIDLWHVVVSWPCLLL